MKIYEFENFNPAKYWYNIKSQLQRHVEKRSEEAFAAGNEARDLLRTPEDVVKRQKWVRREFIKAIGGLPESSGSLEAEVKGIIKQDGFRIEKIIFQSRPQVYVTANLYVPEGLSKRAPAVLFVCGHHMLAKQAPEYQTVCRYLVKAGFVVLAQDPVGQGERFSYYEKALGSETINWGVQEHDYAGQQCMLLGDSIARYFLHDAMRGVDYLISRPEVDGKKIAVTGNSGGGTQTSMMMLADPRIAAAAPGTFVMNRQSYMYAGGCQDAEQIWPGLSRLGIDHEDVLLCMAPKPVCLLAVKYDFFPIEGTRETYNRCKRIWELFGKDSLRLFEDTSRHCYTRNLARRCAEFFTEMLTGNKTEYDFKDTTVLNPEELRCTKTGQVRGELTGPKFVFEENKVRLSEKLKEHGSTEVQRKQKAIKWLKAAVFANREVVKPNTRIHQEGTFENLKVSGLFWFSQKDIINYGLLFQDFAADKTDLTVAIWDGGTTSLAANVEIIKKLCGRKRAVLVLDLSGTGAIMPNSQNVNPPAENYGILHKFSDDLFWLKDSLAAMRVYEVIRCIDAVAETGLTGTAKVEVFCSGVSAFYGELAAALDPRFKKIELKDALPSFEYWAASRYYDPHNIRPHTICGILERLDLPDLRKWFKSSYRV